MEYADENGETSEITSRDITQDIVEVPLDITREIVAGSSMSDARAIVNDVKAIVGDMRGIVGDTQVMVGPARGGAVGGVPTTAAMRVATSELRSIVSNAHLATQTMSMAMGGSSMGDARAIVSDVKSIVGDMRGIVGDTRVMVGPARGATVGGARAVVGGVDYAVGGWASHEIARREAQHALGVSPSAAYPGRTYIHADDAARSILRDARRTIGGGKTMSALRRAAQDLAQALGRLEDRLCAPDESGAWECGGTVPGVTSADLREFASSDSQENDVESLYDLYEAVESVVASVGVDLPTDLPKIASRGSIPLLSSQIVPISDEVGILRLESKVAPYVTSIENLQAALATRLAAISHGLNQRLDERVGGTARAAPKPRPHRAALSRGEEIDAAAAKPPLDVLKQGLTGFTKRLTPFDIVDGAAVPSSKYDGLYLGIASRNDTSRATMLTPYFVGMAAFKTSGRMYAWVVFDGPESRFAIRAEPRSGRVVVLDPEEITNWLQKELRGDPPHKVDLDKYLAFLRSLGLKIVEGPKRTDGEARFNYSDTVPPRVEQRALEELRALTEADWAELDWTDYDRNVNACKNAHETSGNVIVDLKAKTVSAPKVRTGLTWATNIDYRSLVTFHTHPSARYEGRRAEAPSTADITITLQASAFDMQAWALITAPEGTYIIRPGKALATAYLRGPAEVLEMIDSEYGSLLDRSLASVFVSASDAVAALRELGFIAYFRVNCCTLIADQPDIFPIWNRESREGSQEMYKKTASMTGAQLIGLDWSAVAAAGESRVIREKTWLTARIEDGAPVPNGNGHHFESAINLNSYPNGVPGPIFAAYFPEDNELPTAIPHAAIKSAQQNAAIWAWSAFVSPRRVVVFRAEDDGVEIHGPAVWRK